MSGFQPGPEPSMLAIVLAVAFLLFAGPGNALVDMRNMNFSDPWIDIKIERGFDISVKRTYNSRTLYEGLFGFGWCSSFETKLAVLADGRITVTECGAGDEMDFFLADYSEREIQKLVEQLVSIRQSRDTGQTEVELAQYRLELLNGGWQREAAQAGIARDAERGRVYTSIADRQDTVYFDGETYVRRKVGKFEQRMNSDGQLIVQHNQEGSFMRIGYRRGLIDSVANESGESLRFFYNLNSGRLQRIESGVKNSASYEFELKHLVGVNNSWGNAYRYKYDTLHNLTRIDYPDNTFKEIGYDTDKDWVSSFRDRNGCREIYTEVIDDDQKGAVGNHYRTDLVKVCDERAVSKRSYEFFFALNRFRHSQLVKIISIQQGDETVAEYDADHGQPVRTVSPDGEVRHRYNHDGQLEMSRAATGTTRMEYRNSCNKTSRIADSSPSGVLTNVVYRRYDLQCRLSFAYSPQIGRADLEYSQSGALVGVALDDQKVRVEYDARHGKPALVEVEGVGSLIVSYKDDGEIANVDSDGDRIAAVAVARLLGKLVDLRMDL